MSATAEPLTDTELVNNVAAGEQASLAELYQRYAGPLFDFSARIVGRDAAPDVVQATFVKAWASIQKQAAPRYPKAWLYSIARNEAIDELRRSSRAAPTDFDDEFTSLDMAAAETAETSPEVAIQDQEMAQLVWASAAALSEESRSLLDMQLRHDLSSEEIADLLGVDMQNAYKKMSRVRASLEEAVSDELLRRERGNCDELDALTADFESAELTASARRAISKHVRSCDVCEERRRQMTSPTALFARLSLIPFAVPEMAATYERILPELSTSPAAEPPASQPATQSSWWSRAPLGAKIVIIAVPIVVALIVVLLLANSDDSGDAATTDPNDAMSVTHQVGVASDEPMIVIEWTPPPSAEAFSVEWTDQSETLPDDIADLDGDATGVTSPPLDDGSWYFHLRTQGADGSWTSTLHLGPFLIAGVAVDEVQEPSTTVAPVTTVASSTTAAPTTTAAPATSTTEPPPQEDCGEGSIAIDGSSPGLDPRLTLTGLRPIVDAPTSNLWLVACFAAPWTDSVPLDLFSFAFDFGIGPAGDDSFIVYQLHDGNWTVFGQTQSGEYAPFFVLTANGNVMFFTGLGVPDHFEGIVTYQTASTPSADVQPVRVSGEVPISHSEIVPTPVVDAIETVPVDGATHPFFEAEGLQGLGG